jgi:signal transduction histidine kinase
VRLPDLIRTTTFRWTLTIAAVFVAVALALFTVIYRESVRTNEARIGGTLTREVFNTAMDDPERALVRVEARLLEDPLRVRFAGLFDPNRAYLAGNIAVFPEDLEPNLQVHKLIIARRDAGGGTTPQSAHTVGTRLSNGNYYVIARNLDDFAPQQRGMMVALAEGLLPATLLALLAGAVLSMRTERRIADIHRMAQRVMAGHLDERLPSRGSGDDFDKLTGIINAMLDQIEHLMAEVKGVGDDIAHDLRTPLTRVRAALERGRETAGSLDDLRTTVDKGITGLDQALGVTTALLRIAAIEHGQRNAAFGEVDLGGIVSAIVELYEPAAEDKGVRLLSGGIGQLTLRGDRDLLFEAVSNLVDNALKFTPAGGAVTIELVRTDETLMLRVSDTGPGIPVTEREAVFRRFYRSDKSRSLTGVVPGMGLGLSLVAAITRLHGFTVRVAESAQGCTIEMVCNPPAA